MKNAHIITSESVVVVVGDKVLTIKKDQNALFNKIIEAIHAGDYDEVTRLISPSDFMGKVGLKFDEDSGEVLLNNYPLKTNLAERIRQYWISDAPYEPLLKLCEKSLANEREYMHEELFNFLECNDLPITEDGCFLAYKLANADGSPVYQTGSPIRYEVGKVIEEEEAKNERNRELCNGPGLYFGNRKYWGSSSWKGKEWNDSNGTRMFLVKIDPRDVTSVPRQYDNSKGKCWRMEVIKELTAETAREIFDSGVSVISDRYTNRDKSGRWSKFWRDKKTGRFCPNPNSNNNE